MKAKGNSIVQYKLSFIAVVIFIGISSCSNVFEYSPYQANVGEEFTGVGEYQQTKLKQAESIPNESFSFVTIADSHISYSELDKAISIINNMDSIDFVVHLGDMTDKGLLKEYEITTKYLNQLKVPYITCIGNHDYLSNGELIYEQIFGTNNYSFVYKNIEFISFDATTFESGREPNFDWFKQELSNNNIPKIVLSHVPPFDDQYSDANRIEYKSAIANKPILLSIHGHQHNTHIGKALNAEFDFLIPGAISKGIMGVVTVSNEQDVAYEIITF